MTERTTERSRNRSHGSEHGLPPKGALKAKNMAGRCQLDGWKPRQDAMSLRLALLTRKVHPPFGRLRFTQYSMKQQTDDSIRA